MIQEKAAEKAVKLESMRRKENLSKTQQGYIKRLEATLEKLQTPYPRPSRPLYSGKTNILVGVSMGLDKPATVAVVDALAGEVLTYRSVKQLLGNDYRLLKRAQTEKTRIHKNHRRGGRRVSEESNIAQQVDRLLAKSIIDIAREYEASSIVVPDLANIREIVETEVKARAQDKVPDFVEGQKQYAKAYRTQVHQWSYRRLQEAVRTKAEQSGITIEVARQGLSGTEPCKAKALALQGYEKRIREHVEMA